MKYNIAIVSLGCNKNLVDSEILAKYLVDAGHIIVDNPEKADVIFVNTCGFINDAKQEAINTIFEMLELKKAGVKAVFATGCLTKRYRNEIIEQIPELDGILGVYDYDHALELVDSIVNNEKLCYTDGKASYMDRVPGRIISTPKYSAYLKIADGCANKCHYCAIPGIRGDYCSRDFKSLIYEAKQLYQDGVRELLITAQDTTRYGEDKGENRFIDLLRALENIGFTWIRILYAYPGRCSDELLEYINSSKVICHYLDIPIQHTQDNMLRAMNRHYDQNKITAVYNKVRSFDTPWVLRTTVICGYPGEDAKAFNGMLKYLNEHPFELLGAFPYSPEEGTVGAKLPHQTRAATKQSRFDSVMLQQSAITNSLNKSFIGKTLQVVVEGYSDENNSYIGRTEFQAPDVDGCIYITGDDLQVGNFYKCYIEDAFGYDLYGSVLK